MCSLCIASLRGPPIGGQDRYGASYRCSAPYTLCLFEAFPSRGNEKIGGTGYCVTYDTDSQSRNADFISIARRAIRNPRPERLSNLRTFRPSGRSILRTLTPKVCPRAIPQPSGRSPVNLPLCTVGAGPYGNTVNTVQHCFIAPKKLSIPESFLISFKNQNILRIPVNP